MYIFPMIFSLQNLRMQGQLHTFFKQAGSFCSFALSYHTSKSSAVELDKLSHTFSPRFLYSLTWAKRVTTQVYARVYIPGSRELFSKN